LLFKGKQKMKPILFRILLPHLGAFAIRTYGLMVVIGFLAAWRLASWRAKKEGLPGEIFLDFGVWGLIGGVIGARLFHFLQNYETYSTFWDIFKIWQGGLVFYGGFLGGAVACIIFVTRRGLPLLKTLDVATPSVALGLSFSRIGCLLNGCCFGKPTNLVWGLSFPAGSFPYERYGALTLHPTQIYLSLNAFILCVILSLYFKYRKSSGEVLALSGMLYAPTRFVLEFFRGDHILLIRGLSVPQITGIFVFIASLTAFIYLRRK
jgi:phosphatidylglycerol:prolipoprotein diacylglycerol transferase